MRNATFYIPTMDRTTRQVTAGYFKGSRHLLDLFLVCPSRERPALAAEGFQVLECDEPGIARTRQWILEQHTSPGPVVMMDDDLKFAKRRADDPGKFLPIESTADFNEMFESLLSLLEIVPFAGIANRSGANRLPTPATSNARTFDLYALDPSVFRQHDIRFDNVLLMEDFDVTLQLLSKGIETGLLTTFTKDNIGGASALGGCSAYRDSAMQQVAAVDLAVRWPDFVQVVKKETAGTGLWAERWDVRVSWDKAFKAGGGSVKTNWEDRLHFNLT